MGTSYSNKKEFKKLQKKINYLCCSLDIREKTPNFLALTFDTKENADLFVGDSENVNDWNTAFDLPNLGTPFTSVLVFGGTVLLFGGEDIKVKPGLLYDFNSGINSYALIGVHDYNNCIISVGGDAFSYSNGLTEVYLPVCTILYGEYDSPHTDYGAFGACTNLSNIYLPLVHTIGSNCFYDCNTLTSLNFPVLKTAGNFSFHVCTFLTSINAPLLETIGISAFGGCVALVSINLPSLRNTSYGSFQSCTSLTTVNLPQLIIAETYCFVDCTSLTTINAPLLETIGDGCFDSCSALTSINLPLLKNANDDCFYNCTSLTSVNLPLLETAGNGCFSNCLSLNFISLPLLIIADDWCFSGCTSLTNINLPSCTNLGSSTGNNSVFDGISGNTITLTVPQALMTCNGGDPDGDIQSLGLNNNLIITDGLSLTFNAIANADLLVGDSTDVADWNTFFDLPANGTPFTSVEIAGNTVVIYGGANIALKEYIFSSNNSLLHFIDNNGSAISMNNDAFSYSNSLISASLPNVTSAGSEEFFECSVLVSVNLPKVETIGYSFFEDCSSLVNVNLSSLINDDFLSGATFASCTSLVTLDLPSMVSLGQNGASNCTSLTTVNAPLLEIAGDYAFYNCYSVLTVNLPNLKTAGEQALSNLWIMTDPMILPKLEFAGEYCFGDNISCIGFDLPALKTSGEEIFYQCEAAEYINLPSLEHISRGMFSDCLALTELDLPSAVTADMIGSIFSSTPSLISFNAPLLTMLPFNAFYSPALTNIYIPSCVDLGGTVGNDFVFSGIIGNTITLTIPSSLMTCNAGNPDGDIQYLQGNNTVTITTV